MVIIIFLFSSGYAQPGTKQGIEPRMDANQHEFLFTESYSSNSMLTLVRSWIERIAAAKTGATLTTSSFEQVSTGSGSIVSEVNNFLMGLFSSLPLVEGVIAACETAA